MIKNLKTYDYSGFLETFDKMLESGRCTMSQSNDLKRELNRFFSDSKCTGVYYTENGDKMFFGMRVLPTIRADKIYDYLTSEDPIRISEYLVEIDSHLLNPVLALHPREMLAFLLHEVGHVINDSSPIEDARNAMNIYLTTNNESLRMSDSIHYKEILAFGIKDYISKRKSVMYSPMDEELVADEFVYQCGFGQDLDSGLRRICRSNMKMYEDSSTSKIVVFFWTLRLYRHVGPRRIGALHTLNKAKRLVGSRIEKMEIENVIRRINRIDDHDLLSESVSETVKAKMRKMRNNSIRNISDEYYELNMRVRNIQDEDDALYIMRRINNYIGILEDYIYDTDIDDHTKESWKDSLEKFKDLRAQLSKKCSYRAKGDFSIYINYPDIY